MNSKRFVFTTVCFSFLLCALGEDVQCDTNYFFNRRAGECQQCAECTGTNQIIRFPCSYEHDTICGPFVEFDQFHQSPVDNLNPLKNITYDFEDQTISDDDVHYPTNIDSDKKWYTLAMALLGVLSFISLFVGIYIVVVCFICKKRRREKEIICSPDSNSAVPNPTTRLVEPNVYVQFRDGPKRGTPRTAYTTDDEFEADNSNQTISSTSSHYVYFKTAESAPPN